MGITELDHHLILTAGVEIGIVVVDPDVDPGVGPELHFLHGVPPVVGDLGLGPRALVDLSRGEGEVVEIVGIEVIEGDSGPRIEAVKAEGRLEVLEEAEVVHEYPCVRSRLGGEENHRRHSVPRGEPIIRVIDEAGRVIYVVPADGLRDQVPLPVDPARCLEGTEGGGAGKGGLARRRRGLLVL